jgi:uncharacterized protein YndB with AHSA1/START domain
MRAELIAIVMLVLGSSVAAATDPITTEAVVNAPVDQVWKAWTTADGIQTWMVARTDIDLRPGGLWRTSYTRDADLDGDAAIHHRILVVDPGRMLAFQTVKTPKTFPFPTAIRKTWTIVYFDSADGGRTVVTVRMLGYDEDEESQKMRAFFVNGNKATLDALVKTFK